MTPVIHEVSVGTVVLTGGEEPISFERIQGWNGLPAARGSNDYVPGAHGAFERVDVLREPRAVSISGSIQANSRHDAERLFAHVVREAEGAKLIAVVDETGRWEANAEVDSVIPEDPGGWSSYLPFTIYLVTPDPVRYQSVLVAGPVGLPTREGGLVLPSAFPWSFGTSSREIADVVNTGTVPVCPRITVRGSAVSLLVRGGPYRLEYGAFDGVLVFDSLERRAWLNGVDVTRSLVRRDWPVVPAGATAGFSFEAVVPSPEISLLVEYRIGVW